ncbi:hypothetical protein OSTOST_02936, partial [Ostertagia ostertagi]
MNGELLVCLLICMLRLNRVAGVSHVELGRREFVETSCLFSVISLWGSQHADGFALSGERFINPVFPDVFPCSYHDCTNPSIHFSPFLLNTKVETEAEIRILIDDPFRHVTIIHASQELATV